MNQEFDTGQEYSIAGHPRVEDFEKRSNTSTGSGCLTLVVTLVMLFTAVYAVMAM